jgi:hypothetical protein
MLFISNGVKNARVSRRARLGPSQLGRSNRTSRATEHPGSPVAERFHALLGTDDFGDASGLERRHRLFRR